MGSRLLSLGGCLKLGVDKNRGAPTHRRPSVLNSMYYLGYFVEATMARTVLAARPELSVT